MMNGLLRTWALLSVWCVSIHVGTAAAQDGGDTPADVETAAGEPSDAAQTIVRDEPLTLRFDPIVITATRREQPLFDVPASANVVSEEDIFEASYRTLPEALRDVPSVMVQKTAHGQGSPFIRGFTGFRTLLLIDGIRLNNSVFRDGPNQYWNTVDPHSIERLEVIKGPSSVLYGSDAIGGTVNAITKGPNTYGEGTNFGGRGSYRVSSAERSHIFRGEFSATVNMDFGAYAGGTYKQFGELEAGSGRKPKTGYEELDGDIKLEYFFNEDTRIVLAHQTVDLDDAWRTHRTIVAESFEGTTIGSDRRRVLDQNRDLTYAQLHAENIDSLVDTVRVSLSFQSQQEQRDRVRGDGRRDIQGFDADTYGLWAQFETPSDIGRWTYGVEYYRDDVSSFRRDFAADGTLTAERIQGPVADDATYDLLGVYVQNDIPVNDQLNLILGGRYTYANADADAVQDPDTGDRISVEESYDTLVGSARFVYYLDEAEHWNIFGGVSQGFRAPNLSDLTRLDTARTNEIETPSPGLDPEEFIAYEIGAKARYDTASAQASYWYTDISDMIIRQPTGAVIAGNNEVTKRNAGDGYIHGVELQGRWRFHDNFTAFGSFTWMDGEVDTFPTSAPMSVREPISRLMPMTGQVGLRWDAPEDDVWVEGVLTLADEQDDLSTRDMADTSRIPPGGTPGYGVLSLRSGWRVNDNLTLTAVIDNITDEDYRVHGSGINEPGINFIFGVEYRF